MPNDTHETAPTQFVQAGDVQFAYRRFGPRGATPLLLCNYFAANMDDWDPKVTNGLAAAHDVILFDYPGIGRSSGEAPPTVATLTEYCVAFCRAIGLTRFDVFGFSLGGMIAQQLGAEHPDLLRRIILLATGPRGGEGMVFDDLSVDELDDTAALLMKAFFTQSEASQASGRAYLKRLQSRTTDRDTPVSKQSALAALAAIREWGVIPASDRFAMLSKIQHSTLIVHGNKDVVVMPINAFLLAEHLPNAQLIMYPDSSHGAQSQQAEVFLEHVKLFLQQSLKDRRPFMSKTTPEQNKALVLEAFDALFNKRDYAAAERYWSDRYIQHSAHIASGRNGLFNLIRTLPDTLKYENQLIVAEGDYVIAHGRFSGHGRPTAWVAADILRIEDGKLAEHWDVLQDEATKAQSVSGLPMFGDRFPD